MTDEEKINAVTATLWGPPAGMRVLHKPTDRHCTFTGEVNTSDGTYHGWYYVTMEDNNLLGLISPDSWEIP